MRHLFFLALSATFLTISTVQSTAQITGGETPYDLTPSKVEPSELSAGAYQGDVSLFTGQYSGSYPLGSVSTLQGLSFELLMNFSNTTVTGSNPSMIEGVPYGKGWSPGIPTVTVTTDVKNKYALEGSCTSYDGHQRSTQYWDLNEAENEGQPYWLAPQLNIPGVASGRAVFKYVDKTTYDLIFSLQTFDQPIEIRYRNGAWVATTNEGVEYRFEIATARMRNGPNRRILNADLIDEYIKQVNDPEEAMNAETLAKVKRGLMNNIMPSYEFTTWYCTKITNNNHPLEGIVFDYDKYGAFDYFAELRQQFNKVASEEHFRLHKGYTTNIGTTCNELFINGKQALNVAPTFTDIHLQRVYSYGTSVLEEIRLEYGTENNFGQNMLDHRDEEVYRTDSLYSSKVIYARGDSAQTAFNNWNRYHFFNSPNTVALTSQLKTNLHVNQKNPYIGSFSDANMPPTGSSTDMNTNGSNFYIRSAASEQLAIAFDHSFLESPRLSNYTLGANSFVPGDTYEVKTKLLNASNDLGFYDVNVVTGTNYERDEDITGVYKNYIEAGGPGTAYHDGRGESLFSTFGKAIKWSKDYGTMTSGQDEGEQWSSNLFVFPNLPEGPSSYNGFNIQIGPANSDTDFARASSQVNRVNSSLDASSYHAYAHKYLTNSVDESTGVHPLSSGDGVPSNFGIGLPWAQMLPYCASAFNWNGPATELFGYWHDDGSGPLSYVPRPTAFGPDVHLSDIRVIRHSKNPYMLQKVSKYVTNGEIVTNDLEAEGFDGRRLVSAIEFEFDRISLGVMPSTVTSEPLVNSMLRKLDDGRVVGMDVGNQAPDFNSSELVENLKEQNNYLLTGAKRRGVDIETNELDDWDTDLPRTEWFYTIAERSEEDFFLPSYGHVMGQIQLDSIADELGGGKKIVYQDTYLPYQVVGIESFNSNEIEAINLSLAEKGLGEMTENSSFWVLPEDMLFERSYKNLSPRAFRCDLTPSLSYRMNDTYQVTPRVKSLINYGSNDVPQARSYSYQGIDNRYVTVDDLNLRTVSHVGVESGFATTTVHETELNGVSNRTVYHHVNNQSEGYDDKEAFLLFGKLARIQKYSDDDLISEESFEYEAQLAFENGARRIYGRRWPFTDYADYFQGIGGVTNSAGELLSAPLQVYFGEDFDTDNPLPFSILEAKGFSYFSYPLFYESHNINKMAPDETEKMDIYFTSLRKKTVKNFFQDEPKITSCQDIVVLSGDIITGNEGYENTATLSNEQQLLDKVQQSQLTTQEVDLFINSSPLTDTLLIELIRKQPLISKDIINAQGPLSTVVLSEMINDSLWNSKEIEKVISAQSIVGDGVIWELITEAPRLGDKSVISMISPLPTLSTAIRNDLAKSNGVVSKTLKTDLIMGSEVSEELLSEIIMNESGYSGQQLAQIIVNRGGIGQAGFEEMFSRQEPVSFTDLMSIFEGTRSYPNEANLMLLLANNAYTDVEKRKMLGATPSALSSQFFDWLEQNTVFTETAMKALWGKHTVYNVTECGCEIFGDRTIEQITENEYYDASFTGYTTSEGYRKLLGLDNEAGLWDSIPLKYEPSWQLYSTTTQSPQRPGVFTKQEFFYNYDLLNKYDRQFVPGIFPEDRLIFDQDVQSTTAPYEFETTSFSNGRYELGVHFGGVSWLDAETEDPYELPHIPAMVLSRQHRLLGTPFQVTTSRSLSADETIEVKSEYLEYDNDWGYEQAVMTGPSQEYSGEYCFTNYWEEDDVDDLDDGSDGGPAAFFPDIIFREAPRANYIEKTRLLLRATHTQLDTIITPIFSQGQTILPSTVFPIMEYARVEDPDNYILEYIHPFQSGDQDLEWVLITRPNGDLDSVLYWGGERFDGWNYVMTYIYDNGEDEEPTDSMVVFNNDHILHIGWKYQAVLPYEVLTTSKVLQRNIEGLPLLFENERGVRTHVTYAGARRRLWNRVTDPECDNFKSFLNTFKGLPSKITVGAGRLDAEITEFEWDDHYRLAKIKTHAGLETTFEYDNFGRLIATYGDDLLLSENSYSQFSPSTSGQAMDFVSRALSNYVESTTVYSEGKSNTTRKYVSPNGVTYGQVSKVDYNDGTANTGKFISSGRVQYDEWNRPVSMAKSRTYALDTYDFAPVFNSNLIQQTAYEDTWRGRVVKTSPYDVDIDGPHADMTKYSVLSYEEVNCDLDLSFEETQMLFGPDFENVVVYRTRNIDADGNKFESYSHVDGTQFANRTEAAEGIYAVTLFNTDPAGNISLGHL